MIGIHSKFVADTIAHETYDDFWKAMSIQEKYADMDVPAFHLTGWYDDLTHETISQLRQHAEAIALGTRAPLAEAADRPVGSRRAHRSEVRRHGLRTEDGDRSRASFTCTGTTIT